MQYHCNPWMGKPREQFMLHIKLVFLFLTYVFKTLNFSWQDKRLANFKYDLTAFKYNIVRIKMFSRWFFANKNLSTQHKYLKLYDVPAITFP